MQFDDKSSGYDQGESYVSKIDQARLPLKSSNNPSYDNMNNGDHSVSEKKPWGAVDVIEEGKSYKLRRLEILPGKRTSLQKHFHRNEFIYILIGAAIITVEGQSSNLVVNEFVDIPKLTAHRIENQGVINLVILEIQNGEYLGDDDIFRIEDDYGRIEDQIVKQHLLNE